MKQINNAILIEIRNNSTLLILYCNIYYRNSILPLKRTQLILSSVLISPLLDNTAPTRLILKFPRGLINCYNMPLYSITYP